MADTDLKFAGHGFDSHDDNVHVCRWRANDGQMCGAPKGHRWHTGRPTRVLRAPVDQQPDGEFPCRLGCPAVLPTEKGRKVHEGHPHVQAAPLEDVVTAADEWDDATVEREAEERFNALFGASEQPLPD